MISNMKNISLNSEIEDNLFSSSTDILDQTCKEYQSYLKENNSVQEVNLTLL